jgi:Flp pilus assembly protein TadD
VDETSTSSPIYWEYVIGGGIAVVMLLAFLWLPGQPRQSPAESESVDAYVQRAKAYEQGGQHDQAISELHRALALDPGNHTAHYRLGDLLMQQGHYDAAEAEYHAALALGEDTPTLLALGLVALRTGRDEEAALHFNRAAQLDPKSWVAHMDLGIAMLRLGNPSAAAAAFERVIRLAPDNLDARHNLGYARRLDGDLDTAVALLEEVLLGDPERAITAYELGMAYHHSGRDAEARRTFEKLVAAEPTHQAGREMLERLSE